MKYIIVFDLVYGSIPGYLLLKELVNSGALYINKKNINDWSVVPASLPSGIQALKVSTKDSLDIITQNLVKLTTSYGEIMYDVVSELEESPIWNNEQSTVSKRATIVFGYEDSTLPESIPSPSSTKSGNLNFSMGDKSINVAVTEYQTIEVILETIQSQLLAQEIESVVVDSSLRIQSIEEVVFEVSEAVGNMSYTLCVEEHETVITLSYEDPTLPSSVPSPSAMSGGSIACIVGGVNIVLNVDLHDQVEELSRRLAESINTLTTGYTASPNNSELIIESSLEDPSFEWLDLSNVSKKNLEKMNAYANIPQNIVFTPKDVSFLRE
ncbi:MAG: hypothetical protein ACRC0X_02110 [Brevinema sp.]